MTEIDVNMEPWIPAALVMLAMLAGWGLGWWAGRWHRDKVEPLGTSKFSDGIMALLGLLLAFTFAMSLDRHQQRREMVVADSNAIGDFYTCVSLLEEPVRGKTQTLIRTYIEHRLSIAQPSIDEATLQQRLAQIHEMHAQMQAHVKEAVDQKTPIVVPLVNTLNGVTSNHAARLSAVRDRLPLNILLLLGFSAVLTMVIIGRQQSAAKELYPGSTVGFILLVGLVICVILDLNEPLRGWIRVSQEPLEQLLKSITN